MATKAIYTKLDNKYYRVIQDCSNPTNVFRMPCTHSQMSLNAGIKQVNSTVWINPICIEDVKTNMETYNEMLNHLINESVTQIDNIHNRFVLYMDYSIYNEKGNEINHNVVTKEIEAIDMLYPLGVNMCSELIYKQIKAFNSEVSFVVKNSYPMGIMCDCSHSMYNMKINDIIIYQDLINSSSFTDKHYSCSENCYAYQSHTIASQFKNMKKIYSTYDDGIIIAAVEVPFIPRKVVINFHMAVDNTIVVYDEQEIKDIIAENIYNKYHPSIPDFPEDDPSIDEPVIPEGEKYPESDGSEEEVNGKYDYYERVSSDTEGALVVVEDELVGDYYDNTTMIHKSMVINDIPDIEINQYVKYFKVSVMSKCIRLNGGTASEVY